mmetsp:Transcript_9992/g.9917  ORF Transcript_9992/g.9917 Transcript_9992/m.9917 type:complete len:237 (-) Transcript_9992:46-756(-)
MKGLYKKVIKGDYPPLPSRYSAQLSDLIKLLLKVNPAHRPTCDDILNLPAVAQRNTRRNVGDLPENNLLGTIKIPRQIKGLSNNLPAASYEKERSYHSVPAVTKRMGMKKTKDMSNASDTVTNRISSEIQSNKSRVYSEKELRGKEMLPQRVILPEIEPLRPYNADRRSQNREDYDVSQRQRPQAYKVPQVVSYSPYAQGTIAQRIQALKAQYDNVPPSIGIPRQPNYQRPVVQPS